MSLLALERAVYERLALGALAESHLHRATRETDAGLMHGREALIQAAARALSATGPQTLLEPVELPDFLAVTVEAEGRAPWRRHRWCGFEGARIAREIEVEDTPPARPAPAFRHAPLGELVSGRGQRAASDAPAFADPISPRATALAALLHRAVNGRRADLAREAFAPGSLWRGPEGREGDARAAALALVGLFAVAPDLALTLDCWSEAGDHVALLWRAACHTPQGARLTGFVSCLARLEGAAIASLDIVCDPAGMAAAAAAPLVQL